MRRTATAADPSSADLAVWAPGARTVRQAQDESGLSRQELFALMADGRVRFAVKDRKGTRLVAWGDVVRYVATLYASPPKKRAKRRVCA